jgi:hypothetical protein
MEQATAVKEDVWEEDEGLRLDHYSGAVDGSTCRLPHGHYLWLDREGQQRPPCRVWYAPRPLPPPLPPCLESILCPFPTPPLPCLEPCSEPILFPLA